MEKRFEFLRGKDLHPINLSEEELEAYWNLWLKTGTSFKCCRRGSIFTRSFNVRRLNQ